MPKRRLVVFRLTCPVECLPNETRSLFHRGCLAAPSKMGFNPGAGRDSFIQMSIFHQRPHFTQKINYVIFPRIENYIFRRPTSSRTGLLAYFCASDCILVSPEPDFPGWCVKEHVTYAPPTACNFSRAEEFLRVCIKPYKPIGSRPAFHEPQTILMICSETVGFGRGTFRHRPLLNFARCGI